MKSLISGISVLFGFRKDPATPALRPSGAVPGANTTPERSGQASPPGPAEASATAATGALAETSSAAEWQVPLAAARQTRRESGPDAALPLFEDLRRAAPDRAEGWLEAAACLRDLRRFDQAEAMLADRLQASSSDPGALHDLARLFERRGAWPQAEALWRRLLALPGAAWWAHAGLATALQRQGRLPEAGEVLSEALSLHPQEVVLACDYARLAQASGNRAEAKARWETASAQFANHPVPLRGLAAALQQDGDTAGAERLLRTSAAANPDDLLTRHDLARLLESRADWTGAEQIWHRLRDAGNAPWWVHHALAGNLQRQDRLPEADEVLSEAVAVYPAEIALACDYARVAQASGNQAEAKTRWETASARFANHPEPLRGLAAALKEEGDAAGAERVLRAASAANPDDLWTQNDLARLLEDRADWTGAEQIWRRLRDAGKAPSSVHAALAKTLQRQDRLREADEVLSKAMSLYPAEVVLACDYARLAQAGGNQAEAKARWETASARFANHPAPLRGLVAVLKQAGDVAGAERLLRTAVAADPDDLWTQEDLGRLLEEREDWAGAEQIWRRLCESANAPSWVHSALAATLRQQDRTRDAQEVLADGMT